MNHNRRTMSLLLFAVTILSSLAVAQNKPARTGSDSATSCSYTFSSGSGLNATQFCVTATGNITQFSRPAGIEYINSGVVGEGYGVCDFNAGTAYWDYAGDGDNGWGAPTLVSQTGNSVKISRTTTDGNFTLTQTITNVNASVKSPGAAAVSMALKNNTGTSRFMYILRYANVDVAPDPTMNHFDYTLDTAYGLTFSNHGLASTNNTFTYGWDAGILDVPNGPAPCTYSYTVPPVPFVGDGSLLQVWSNTLAPHSSMTVALTYKPI